MQHIIMLIGATKEVFIWRYNEWCGYNFRPETKADFILAAFRSSEARDLNLSLLKHILTTR